MRDTKGVLANEPTHVADPQNATDPIHHRFEFRDILPSKFTAIAILHLACLAAPFTFSWSALIVAFLLNWIVMSFGVSMGYHRLLTHRSFETPRFFRYVLTILATLAWQGGPFFWVGTHRVHHRDSDQEGDPHSPLHGFPWAHMFWCVVKDPWGRDCTEAAKDLKKDPVMVWIDRLFFLPQIILAVVLYALGGWSWVIWGIAVRTVVAYHSTWAVNSASHLWGYRNFDTRENSRNNWWVAILSWGEGWHNNHHAFQRSASFGLRWFEFDITYQTIRLLSLVGLTRNIHVPKVATGGTGESA